MVAVQSSTCAPIVRAFDNNLNHAPVWENAHTVAPGLRVPAAVGDYLILDVVRKTNGTAVAIEDNDILLSMKNLAKSEGIALAPEAAATYAASDYLTQDGWLDKSDNVLLLATGSGLTTPDLWID